MYKDERPINRYRMRLNYVTSNEHDEGVETYYFQSRHTISEIEKVIDDMKPTQFFSFTSDPDEDKEEEKCPEKVFVNLSQVKTIEIRQRKLKLKAGTGEWKNERAD